MEQQMAADLRKRPRRALQREFLANRLFMLISGLLIATSLALFLWLAGVLEWRGSSGSTDIEVTLQCGNPAPAGIASVAFVDLEESSIEFDFDPNSLRLDQTCPETKIRSERRPRAVFRAGSVDAPGDDQLIAASFSPKAIGLLPPMQEAVIPTVNRLRLDFKDGELLHHVGLGESDVYLHFDILIAQKDSFDTEPKTRLLQIRPPEGFYVGFSQPSASLQPNDLWNVDLTSYDGNQRVEVSFKNDKLSRLDHIIDSSIAALLGVGAGGVMSAWLALRISRTNRENKLS